MHSRTYSIRHFAFQISSIKVNIKREENQCYVHLNIRFIANNSIGCYLPSHNASAFQFCHLLVFHTPILICERIKMMWNIQNGSTRWRKSNSLFIWLTHVWYCCWRKLNSSFIRSNVSAIVNLIGPCCGGPFYEKNKRKNSKRLVFISLEHCKLTCFLTVLFVFCLFCVQNV